MREKLC
ncbi:hypothetical protein Avbf_18275 [Armadillidium vulgare]|nr:hypothetical protein Avbf_18275 [Armadillidium vulgare]